MAGFLAPNYVPEFNPAISTIPLELYTNVIVGKQQAYDQGVANVQSYIHNVTGLEVGRGSDKAYYDSKIAEFKDKIGTTLTSDFSNQGVVMKAGGMASQLYNDKRIRNSVMSYAYKKDYIEQLSKAQQDGTYAEENAALGLKQIEAWENGGDDAVLGKLNYIAYDEYMPRLTSWLKNIHPDVRVDQNSPIGTDGKPVPYVLVEGKIQEITSGKVREATEAFFSMDSKANQQRSITASYRGSQMGDDVALASLRSYHQQSSKDIDDQINFYQQRKALVSGDKDKEKIYDDNIATLTQNKAMLDENYQNDLASFTTNPNGVKTNIWYRQQQNSIASTFSYNQNSQKYVDDPRFDIYKFGVEQDYKERKLQSDEEQARLSRENAMNIALLKEGGSDSSSTSLPPGMIPSATPTITSEVSSPADAARVYEDKVNNDVDAANQQLFGMVYEAYKTYDKGRMVSAASNVIEKGEDGRYRLKNGAHEGAVLHLLGGLKHEYEEGKIDVNNPNYDVIHRYFGATDDQYGEYFYKSAMKNKSEWDNTKNSNLRNRKSYTDAMSAAQRYDEAAQRATQQRDLDKAATLKREAARFRSLAMKEGFNEDVVGEFAMKRVKERTKPSLTVAKDTKDGGDTYKRMLVTAVNKINSLPDVGNIPDLNKALDAAKGASIVYDNKTDQFTLNIETAGSKIPPLPLTHQEASLFGGSVLRESSNPYARIEQEVLDNDGTSNPRLSKIGDEFTLRTRIHVDSRTGSAKPVVEYKYHKAGDAAEWMPIKRATGLVTGANVGRAYEFNQTLHNMSRDEFLLILGQDGIDISQFSN